MNGGRWIAVLTASALSLAQLACGETQVSSEPDAGRQSDADANETTERDARAAFDAFWYQGFAEIGRYELEQARYGEIRRGDAVLVFVTEPFDPESQVKSDEPADVSGAWPVIKLNAIKRFSTGIYDYSLMSSIFTPVDVSAGKRTLKVTTSVQDWCGQVWMQLNALDGRYRVESRSYFQTEGDEEFELDAAWLEDEIWNRIRIDPESLPRGEVRMIPGTQQSRLRHRPLRVERATASLSRSEEGIRTYVIDYESDDRQLKIRFEAAFPHQILGWEETYRDGFGPDAAPLTTRAARTHVLRDPYWRHNDNEDLELRDELGLPR